MDHSGNACIRHSARGGELLLCGTILVSFFSPRSFPAARGYFDGYTPTIWGGRNCIIWLAVIRGIVHDSQRQKNQTLVSSSISKTIDLLWDAVTAVAAVATHSASAPQTYPPRPQQPSTHPQHHRTSVEYHFTVTLWAIFEYAVCTQLRNEFIAHKT